jgi:putative transposase
MFLLSFIFNILFFSIIILLLYFNSTCRLIAKYQFLKAQLEVIKEQKGKKKYKTTIFQKIELALLFSFLRFPKRLCYILKPETILKWYRNIVKKFWTFPFAKNNFGRPSIPPEIVDLILKLKRENINWGCRKIHGELKKLDIFVSKSKIAEILVKQGLDPTDYGLSWSTFLKSHIKSIFAVDIKAVTSILGTRLFVFFFISHYSRKIIHYNVTAHPAKQWINQQLKNFTFNFDERVYLVRDNDQLFEYIDFDQFNIEDVPIAFQSPDMNAVVERFIGSFNREALDKFVIINENQLRNIVCEYVHYYNNFRPHQGIGNIPIPDFEKNKFKELKLLLKKPSYEINKLQFLNGYLNHYYYKNTA